MNEDEVTLPGTLVNPPTEKIEPMSLPVGGKMRRGVFYEYEQLNGKPEKLFLFVNEETGGLWCYRVKIGDNQIRATTDIFSIPRKLLRELNLNSGISWAGSGLKAGVETK